MSKEKIIGPIVSKPSTPERNQSKTHADYWKTRLFPNPYRQDGKVIGCGKLAVKIQHRGRRETFSLQSTSRELAAKEAKDIYIFASANGMLAARAKFKPETTTRSRSGPMIRASGKKDFVQDLSDDLHGILFLSTSWPDERGEIVVSQFLLRALFFETK